MKKNYEKGATGMDVIAGLVIFVIASTAIVNLYYQIYITAVTVKIHEVAVGCITEVFERIDLESYDSVTQSNVEQWIEASHMKEYFNEEKNNSSVTCSVSNYSEELKAEAEAESGAVPEVEDVIKIVHITLTYNVAGTKVNFPIDKIKVKEL